MSEKWKLGVEVLKELIASRGKRQISVGKKMAEYLSAHYVLDNGIEAAPCPPGVRAIPGYQAYCVICGKGLPQEAEFQFWMSIGGAQSELDSDSFQALEDGRRVCDIPGQCWKWCECEDCGGEEKIIGTDQDTCQDAVGAAGHD